MGDLGRGDVIKKTVEYPLGDMTKWAMLSQKGTQGYAGIGGNIGFDVTVTLPVEGLGIFGGIDIFANVNNSDIRSYYDDWSKQLEKEIGIKSADFRLPNMINIPILFGVNYLHNFNHIVGIWGEAGIGPNFRLIDNFTTEINYTALQTDPITGNSYDVVTEKTKYDSATTLAFKIGGGVMLWNRMSIGLDYYSLGSAKINAKYELKQGKNVVDIAGGNFKGEKAIYSGELVVRVGYHF